MVTGHRNALRVLQVQHILLVPHVYGLWRVVAFGGRRKEWGGVVELYNVKGLREESLRERLKYGEY